MDDYISKPLDQGTLAARLSRWGGAAQGHAAAAEVPAARGEAALNPDVIGALLDPRGREPGPLR